MRLLKEYIIKKLNFRIVQVDTDTAYELKQAFLEFDQNPENYVAIFRGLHGTFCTGGIINSLKNIKFIILIYFNTS